MQEISDKDRVVRVTIFGEEYSIKGHADENYIVRVAQYVDKKMRDIALKSKNRSPNKIAVLTALNLADRLLSLEDQSKEDREHVEDKAKNILELLDGSLTDSEKP
jgi:cell division protein ZapA